MFLRSAVGNGYPYLARSPNPGGSKNDAAVVSQGPVQQCRWSSGGPAVPTASPLVGWKRNVVHAVAYNLSTTCLCRCCLLSERQWHDVLRRYLVLQLSPEVKADRMVVLETQKSGRYMINVL